jgi:Cohesin domain
MTTRSFTAEFRKILLTIMFTAALFFGVATVADAATMSLSPGTGVYASGATFTVRVSVNSSGKSINAAEGTISFNPSELSVVSVSRSGSIFNLWVAEPSFSNGAGTVSFSGGLPAGYTGSSGNIMSITFRAKGSGASKVSFANGSVLANDGMGTNVLTSMSGGTFTINAAAPTPEAEEVVVEYVAPANTPAAPKVTSSTHGDQNVWHTAKQAVLNWDLPAGITAVRTSLDNKASSVPTKVYDSPIRTITLNDLDEGVSYFHVQLKNEDGWGKVSHYRLAVDSEKPTAINIGQPEGFDANNPEQQITVDVTDSTSEVKKFKVQIDNGEPFEFIKQAAGDTIKLPSTGPGYHTVVVEAFDEAGNSIIGNYSFNVESFEKPTFVEFPNEINEQVIPVIKGKTRPNATVEISLVKIGSEPTTYQVRSDGDGNFTFIPEGRFTVGVYEIKARASDEYGAQSLDSDTIRIAVQQPGFIRIGSMLVSYLSVIIPLIILAAAAVIGSWYLVVYLRRFRRKLRKESGEALEILGREFASLQNELHTQEALIANSRKTKKLTKAEADMVRVLGEALQKSKQNVEKEINDVSDLTNGADTN